MEVEGIEEYGGGDPLELTPTDNQYYPKKSVVRTPPPAVLVRNASKSYFGFSGRIEVLKGLNMTVLQGHIYGLLGCSGCGKSTTLSCVVGLDRFQSGDLSLFGKPLGSKGLAIPGKNVGYMPQDIALYNDFSISETFKYFGLLNGMSPSKIDKALQFYTDLLKLPTKSKWICNLSGGQRRRVSFGISCLHEPKLLILDEPTVGVDPLLREDIWRHLIVLAKTKKTTVVITTHYVEEARRADRVGIMSDGILVGEESPSTLMRRLGTSSLDKAVIELVRASRMGIIPNHRANEHMIERENNKNRNNMLIEDLSSVKWSSDTVEIKNGGWEEPWEKSSGVTDSFRRIRGLIYKNVGLAFRSLLILTIISAPPVGVFVVYVGGGNNLSSVNFGIVNEEMLGSNQTCAELQPTWDGLCELEHFSCKLTHVMNTTSDYFDLMPYNSTDEAEAGVRSGLLWGYLHIPREFSWYLYERAVSGANLSLASLNESIITARLDKSNKITSILTEFALFDVYQEFIRRLLGDCKYHPENAELGLTFKKPILGTTKLSLRDFMLPSFFISLIFYWCMVNCGLRFTKEKRSGVIERSIVAGVKMWEIFVSYCFAELLIAIYRYIVIFAMIIYWFEMEIKGSMVLLAVLLLIMSYCGAFVGLILGILCTEEGHAALIALAIFLPNMMLAGIVWPVEGMPVLLQKIATILPCTLPSESYRSIMTRGWGFTHPNVWPGFAVATFYAVTACILAVTITSLRIRRNE